MVVGTRPQMRHVLKLWIDLGNTRVDEVQDLSSVHYSTSIEERFRLDSFPRFLTMA
jgi:hypothetical protein